MIRTRAQRNAVTALLTLSLLTPAVAACAEEGSGSPSARHASSSATEAAALSLPRPSGPYETGRDTLHLVDDKRRDPWVPSAGPRELMVSVFYPARRGGDNGDRAPYLATKEAELLLKGQKLDKLYEAQQLTSVRTNARSDARPARGRHPLVVLSPGFTLHRATLTTLAETLASHGYLVALVDHAYESFGTEFPGGNDSSRIRTCVACEKVEEAPNGDAGEKQMLAKAARNRAADISFVVDELTGRSRPGDGRRHDYAALIDTRRIGAAGHSLGGNAAAVAVGTDHRIRAAANLDGTFFAPVPPAGTGRPVLMLGTRKGHNPRAEDATWPRQWHRLHGWKRWLTVADSGHLTFTDLPILGGQLNMTDPSAPLSGKRSGEITTGYVTAFFDKHLRDRHSPLLDGPSKADPEVAFHSP
ncbi:alpha/beta hydrolase family protein [Streptomyces sp. BA2]|uniref:alpha/beta hydrolase family protein n=1 Tax=Streptomyces sp. BA2 TaxID=436595 RepID=UPI00132A85D6|nr:alpha/beta hydrolase [Streptomyces sp. BA2]MWA09585.1 alpha/beta hydrolase [Streptomyces sp. BA2]